MMPLCRDQGVGVIPWSPLAMGLLAGLNRQTAREKNNQFSKLLDYPDVNTIIDNLIKVAETHKVKPATVALAWSLSKDYMTSPIVGCSKTSYVDVSYSRGVVDEVEVFGLGRGIELKESLLDLASLLMLRSDNSTFFLSFQDAIRATALKLSDEEIKSLEESYKPKPVQGFS